MDTKKQRIGFLEGGLSALTNIVLFVLKLMVGVAAGSVAMKADAWHTLSDTLTSIIVIGGFWISSRPRDRQHPFGHGRAENIGGIVIGVLIAVVGAGFARESLLRLRDGVTAVYGTTAVIVFGLSVLIKEGLARFSLTMGRRYNAPSLVADGWHHRSDALASALIVIGALAGSRLWWVDGVLGLIVSGFLFKAAWDVIGESSRALLGEPPTPDLLERIGTCRDQAAPELADIHHVHVHRYGDHAEITLHARLPGHTTLSRAHASATRLEDRLREEGWEATIHMESGDGRRG